MIHLTNRLKTIAQMVEICDTVADIGTDHAYLPVYLMQNNICKRAIASDIKKGPAEAAERTVQAFSLSDHIEVRIGNGLAPLAKDESACIVIAGMGGRLICDILEKGKDVISEKTVLLLQPMTAVQELRLYLCENGFSIKDEALAAEGEKLYNVIKAAKGEVVVQNKLHFIIGEKLFENNHPLLLRLIKKEQIKLKKKHSGLKKAKNADNNAMETLEETLFLLKEAENEALRNRKENGDVSTASNGRGMG